MSVEGVDLILCLIEEALDGEVLLVAQHLLDHWEVLVGSLTDNLPGDEVPDEVAVDLGESVEKVHIELRVTDEGAGDERVWKISDGD